jgi:hypothetical protein
MDNLLTGMAPLYLPGLAGPVPGPDALTDRIKDAKSVSAGGILAAIAGKGKDKKGQTRAGGREQREAAGHDLVEPVSTDRVQ